MTTLPSPAGLVREFHETFRHGGRDTVMIPPPALRDFRKRLMTEEVDELHEAMDNDDIVGVAHELADVVYVAYGTALNYGIDLDACVHEIHRANMTKDLNPTGGKAIKGARFTPANVASVLVAA